MGESMKTVSLNQLSQRGLKIRDLDEPVSCECGFYGLAGQLVVTEEELEDENTEMRCPECGKRTWDYD
jgi:predicted RNA-binding Zn-ribbon protein involved in translation (DUF1610 family)